MLAKEKITPNVTPKKEGTRTKPRRYSVEEMMKIFGKSEEWVTHRLERFNGVPQTHIDEHGEKITDYSLEIFQKLEMLKNGWQMGMAVTDEEDTKKRDAAGMFAELFLMTKGWIKPEDLWLFLQEEVDQWFRENLVEERDGKLYFTREAALVVRRIQKTEKKVAEVRRMTLTMD